ncbi:MAG TPA: MFS transporter [Bdellovibrionales bacterium]|nr:MFS transporter [Bdellovibrionales bacterium]
MNWTVDLKDAMFGEMKVEAQNTRGRSPLAVIFLTVFIDLIGFGIIIPLSPFLAREFNASAFEVGLLLSVYSIMQFIFSPMWGSLSDRIGRRPVILISLLGGAISYIAFGFATELWVLFLARAFAGIFGGNISTAHAYIADVTKPEERSKGMGLIGAAFGIGFIVGPLLGAGLGILGAKLGSEPPFGMGFSAIGAAALCFGNLVLAYFRLGESLPPEKRKKSQRRNRIKEILHHFSRPQAGPLMIVFFLSGLAMAQMEAMLFPYVADVFGWGLQISSYGFAYVGVLMAFTQGWLVRRTMAKVGERKTLFIGLCLFALSLFMIPFSLSVAVLAIAMTILAVGNGLMRPPNLGLISLATPADEQGAAMGVTNSLASLGRILGPIIGGVLYERIGHGAPFMFAAVLTALAAFLALSATKSTHHV